ncbi:hypothetical protein ABZP36_020762 [Zizania latifolia]
MAASPQSQSLAAAAAGRNPPHKRRAGGKGNPGHSKKLKRSDEPVRRSSKPSDKFLKLLRKRARDYNSDDDEPLSESEEVSCSEDESAVGFARFEQGCRAFRVAFSKIMAKKLPDDPLGPVLSAHKKLVAAKLAEDAGDHKPKGDSRKEKRMAAEKGHVIPANHLDSKEKDLIKVATQGVVRLFNAVSKSQNSRKGLSPSSSKDAKVLAKERKQTFLMELNKSSNQSQKGQASSNFSEHISKDKEETGWAPLRDTYMLGSKLKDWDKMQVSDVANEQSATLLDDSSDEE